MRGIHRAAEPEVPLHQQWLADATRADDVHEGAVRGEEAAPDGLHQEQSPAPRLGRHACRLLRVEGERLLAQDVLARLQQGKCVNLVA